VIVQVDDIERAAELYASLLGVPGRRVSPGRHYFDCGGTLLACFDPRSDGDDFDARPNPGHLYFSVGDLEGVYERAKRLDGCRITDAIAKRPWGETSFYLRDPFGHRICFVAAGTEFTG
jgi:catechol 2,3-dioxygenase-like lactoylglutathione lyase family enzyme